MFHPRINIVYWMQGFLPSIAVAGRVLGDRVAWHRADHSLNEKGGIQQLQCKARPSARNLRMSGISWTSARRAIEYLLIACLVALNIIFWVDAAHVLHHVRFVPHHIHIVR